MEQFIEETTTDDDDSLVGNANLIFAGFIFTIPISQSARDLYSSPHVSLSPLTDTIYPAAPIYFRISLMKIGSSSVLIRLQA